LNNFSTDQEKFWAGDFGDNYIERNQGEKVLASNLNFFSQALQKTQNLKNCIEFGANIGMNIRSLKYLFPNLDCSAVEINIKASKLLSEIIPVDNIYVESILDFNSSQRWDLVITKGVLIHIDPTKLQDIYQILYKTTNKYILIGEYYSKNPKSLTYRGYDNKLYTRDFAGEIMNKFQDLKLLDYRFHYHKDSNFPQDDITWFLLQKIN